MLPGQAQKPGTAVGHLEVGAGAEQGALRRDAVRLKDFGNEGIVPAVAGHARVGHQRPHTVHGRMPVEAAAEGGVAAVPAGDAQGDVRRQLRGDA